jgi:hypothetical protein
MKQLSQNGPTICPIKTTQYPNSVTPEGGTGCPLDSHRLLIRRDQATERATAECAELNRRLDWLEAHTERQADTEAVLVGMQRVRRLRVVR